jgi:hypothetical protein
LAVLAWVPYHSILIQIWGGEGRRHMRSGVNTALALVITSTAVAGCEKSPKDKLQGRWLGESIENVPAAQAPKANGWVKGAAMEFAGNKVTVTIPAEAPRSGTFKVARADGDRLLVSFQREAGGHDEAEMQMVGDQMLKWRIGDGREIVMLKSKN